MKLTESIEYTLTQGPNAGQKRAAIVSAENEDGTVDLAVFLKREDALNPSCVLAVTGYKTPSADSKSDDGKDSKNGKTTKGR